ncbi:DUF362 domain-containing protein [Ktedonobacter racemifer]|uniref:4Fe-4S ferredoxin-type domain-containing protein n=1 Tax=Ktedonobacter racemifer DSM 44963 TaxID=485913 RepID=D6TN18_KTERA|nr:DUF362 domain-containing protein [Ktedonobacter racemifer]EFH87168.1 protein of unknown function DUF362 [Ktedonobacter racemifer DSM 44963]
MDASKTAGYQPVSIVRTVEGIEEATHRAIAGIGGMETVMRGAKVAVLKPNFVAGRRAETGATTSFAVLKAVAEEVHACGAEPVLCEMPGTEFDREATYTLLGVEGFCARHKIRIARLDLEGGTSEWREVHPTGAKRLRSFELPRLLDDARLINLPVLKTHVVSGMTLSMKNLMGLLPRPARRAMHTLGIDQCIVDMNLGLQADLNIVDGSVGQDGEGPLYGEKANLQVLVAGRSSLAVDLACCSLVNVSPRAIPHLRLALKHFGQPEIHFTHELPQPLKTFRLPRQNSLYRLLFWLMYPLDYPYTWLAQRGKHLCTTLYSTGLVGTHPVIERERCTRCGECVRACPLPEAINLQTLKVNYTTCQRCLLCYEACPEQAISVKGYSGARS